MEYLVLVVILLPLPCTVSKVLLYCMVRIVEAAYRETALDSWEGKASEIQYSKIPCFALMEGNVLW